MDEKSLRELFEQYKREEIDLDAAIERLKVLPYEDLGFAKVDHHRSLRAGVPEVIFGQGKTPEQILSIVESLYKTSNCIMITRTTMEVFELIKQRFKEAYFNAQAKMILIQKRKKRTKKHGLILVICAGTSDIPVAEEAAITAELLGNNVQRLYDVGVAGIHRLFDNIELLRQANVLIVVAGMEGALPSIVGGMVESPVIAVPTSVGYGASFGGLAALLGMLNSCAPGVCVVNIDNGFGAGFLAHRINNLSKRGKHGGTSIKRK